MGWLEFITSFICGAICIQLGMWLERRKKKLPYKWDCGHEGCTLHIEAQNYMGLMMIVDGHLENVHGIKMPE